MDKLGKILIIDDNRDVLFALRLLLEPHAEKIKVMLSPERIEHFIKDFRPDIVLLDMNFTLDTVNGREGLDCLQKILRLDARAAVVMMTAYADTDKAVQAIKAGAVDFVSKPWEKEKLLATLFSAMRLRASQDAVDRLEERVEALSADAGEALPPLIGESAAMKQIGETIGKLRDTDAPILLLGENGTGKDVLARRLWKASRRSAAPFVEIDLGSVPESLFESELFGYEKGAFTDARRSGKPGRMELAQGGTLFLDEIGNLSLPAQAKLLTALEKKRIVRLGGTQEKPIDVRLICATNADLRRRVQEETFRQDLFYRINTVEIRIPPLREREGDVRLLADYFLGRYVRKYNKEEIRGISREAYAKLERYSWPGNVRELQHAVERAVILCGSYVLHASDFLLDAPAPPRKSSAEVLNLEELERNAVKRALELCGMNVTRAAEMLGITRYALYRKMEKWGL